MGSSFSFHKTSTLKSVQSILNLVLFVNTISAFKEKIQKKVKYVTTKQKQEEYGCFSCCESAPKLFYNLKIVLQIVLQPENRSISSSHLYSPTPKLISLNIPRLIRNKQQYK